MQSLKSVPRAVEAVRFDQELKSTAGQIAKNSKCHADHSPENVEAATPNKLSIGRMKAQMAAGVPEFDPYDQLENIAKTFLERARAEQRRDKPNMRLVDDLLDKAARVLRDMVPYKRPRLTATKVSGDKEAPLFDLSTLTDSELAFLRRTILKAQPITEGE